MRLPTLFQTGVVAALVGILSLCAQAQAAKPLADREWLVFESTHFTLLSSIDATFVRDLAIELQVIDALAGRRATLDTSSQPAHTFIVLLPSHEFERLSQSRTAISSFFAAGDRNYLLSRASVTKDIGQAVRRAYARVGIQSLAQPALPYWFQQGFSAYLEGIRVDGDQLNFAVVDENRYFYLGLNNWLSMEWIVDSAVMSQLDGRDWHTANAQSWLLIHYLNHGKDADQSLLQWLDAYSALRASGMDEFTSFAKIMDSEPATFRRMLLAYFSGCCKNYVLPLARVLPEPLTHFSAPSRERVTDIMAQVASAAERSEIAAELAAIAEAYTGDPSGRRLALQAAFASNPSQFEYGWELVKAHRDNGDIERARLFARYLYNLTTGEEALAALESLEQTLYDEPDES